MKKISLSLIFIVFFQNMVFAQINTTDAVDLPKTSKYYASISKNVDDLKLMEIYPDHTFRGSKLVDRKEITQITLKLLKFIESEKKVSLKKPNSIIEFYPDIAKDEALIKTFTELSENYSFNLFKINEKNFNPQKSINMADFNYIINRIMDTYKDIDKNPYLQKDSKYNYNSLENLLKIKIIKNKYQFKPNSQISRYELSAYLLKIVDYIKKS